MQPSRTMLHQCVSSMVSVPNGQKWTDFCFASSQKSSGTGSSAVHSLTANHSAFKVDFSSDFSLPLWSKKKKQKPTAVENTHFGFVWFISPEGMWSSSDCSSDTKVWWRPTGNFSQPSNFVLWWRSVARKIKNTKSTTARNDGHGFLAAPLPPRSSVSTGGAWLKLVVSSALISSLCATRLLPKSPPQLDDRAAWIRNQGTSLHMC